MNRRDLLKQAAAVGVISVTGMPLVLAQTSTSAPKATPSIPPFGAAGPADANPLQDELKKYPKCRYCGMDRAQFQDRRHLIQYENDFIDPTCSLHCTALGLGLNMDLGPKVIYAADYGSTEKMKPMVSVDKVRYLVGSDAKGVMTTRSKLAFSDENAANRFKKRHGGEVEDFNKALVAAYSDMAADTAMIRKRRAERRARQK